MFNLFKKKNDFEPETVLKNHRLVDSLFYKIIKVIVYQAYKDKQRKRKIRLKLFRESIIKSIRPKMKELFPDHRINLVVEYLYNAYYLMEEIVNDYKTRDSNPE